MTLLPRLLCLALMLLCTSEIQAAGCKGKSCMTKGRDEKVGVEKDCLSPDNNNQLSSYFINLPGSVKRRFAMEKMLRSLHLQPNRVVGSLVKEIYVARHDNFTFKYGKEFMRDSPDEAKYIVDFVHGLNDHMMRGDYDNTNTARELSCLLSHFMAIRQAIYSTECTRYALIMEDDIFFGFIVNMRALLMTAQKDFGTLQLHTNNPKGVSGNFEGYLKDPQLLWRARPPQARWWSAGAYIIDKVKWKPVIDKLMYVGDDNKFHFTIIAGKATPCLPSICCTANGTFIHELPCFVAYSGYQADAMIYEYLPSYFFKLPLFNIFPNLSMQSSVQWQNQTVRMNFTRTVFDTTNDIFHLFYNGTHKLPPAFARLLPQENLMLRLQNVSFSRANKRGGAASGTGRTKKSLANKAQ